MDWKKFSEEVPENKKSVLIYWEGSFHIASFERKDETFNFCNDLGRKYCRRNEIVFWANLTEPEEIKKIK